MQRESERVCASEIERMKATVGGHDNEPAFTTGLSSCVNIFLPTLALGVAGAGVWRKKR